MTSLQAIARIMADKVYTSAEFKRERDNFQVDDFLINWYCFLQTLLSRPFARISSVPK